MKKINFPFILLCIYLFVTGCTSASKITNFQPEPDDAIPLVYDNSPSFLNLPIKIKLKDIENKTNSALTDLIYDDSNIEDDNIEIKIWKLAPIQFENNLGKIKTILPLKATIRYRIGTKKLGVQLYNTKEFNLNGVVTLTSEVNLTNWKLQTKTQFQSIDWNESPTMSLLGKNIPITFLVNSSLPLFKSKIEKKIDKSIAKSMDFKPNVLDALEKICRPFQMSQEYESWLRVTPIEIYTTNAELIGNSIHINMSVKCFIETLIGKKPESRFNSSTLILKPVTSMPSAIKASVVAVSNYQDASRIITQNFRDKEFASGRRKIKVLNTTIWHKKNKMSIALEVKGSVNGTIYLTGIPKYNETTKELYFDEMDYALETKNKLLQTASWLAQGLILKNIQSNCKYSIRPNLEEGVKNLSGYLKNYSPIPGVYVNGRLDNFEFNKIQLTNQAIIAFLTINGEVSITVDGFK